MCHHKCTGTPPSRLAGCEQQERADISTPVQVENRGACASTPVQPTPACVQQYMKYTYCLYCNVTSPGTVACSGTETAAGLGCAAH